jgi:RNA polymerase sigma-70 factor, ECF subfamily
VVVSDDLRLLSAVRQLDPDALTEVHDTYYVAIFRYIAARVGNREVAADLASDVFVRLLAAVRDNRAPQNTLKGWLYRVASIVVADYHRRAYRARRYEILQEAGGESADPHEIVHSRQSVESLHQALTRLTEDQQEVIALRYGFGMPVREVAETMNKSEGAVKQLQARAVAALSKQLKGWRT